LFYAQVVEIAKPSLAVVILDPFFNSPATFRFLECALEPFFSAFLFEHTVTRPADRKQLIAPHGSFLIDCFVKAAPLLPESHLKILRTIRAKEWSTEHFADLVLVRWLWRATALWLAASPLSGEQRYLDRVLAAVGCQKQAIRKLYHTLFSTTSLYTAPTLFHSFDQNFLTFYLCVNDLCLLARMLQDHFQGGLPCGLTFAEFLEVDARFQYHWFWCHLFQRSQVREPPPKYRLVFPEVLNRLAPAGGPFVELLAMANAFERFMEEKRKVAELRRWRAVVAANVTILMTRNLPYLMAHPEIPIPHDVHQLMTLSCVDQAGVGPHFPEIAGLAARWDESIARKADEHALKAQIEGSDAARRWIWEGIRTIRSAGKVPLARVFRLLIGAMTKFDCIAEMLGLGNALMCNILRMLPGVAVIVPFVIFNGTVAHEKEFMREAESKIWVKLERCLLLVLQEEPSLLKGIFEKQAELERQTARTCRRVLRMRFDPD
jgi:hypothetical protein